VFADNSLITNCGSNINIILGGVYSFTNCTVASYSTYISHKYPVLAANNFASINGSTITTSLQAAFTNCIFWGETGFVENETVISKQGTDPFDVTFTNCIYRNATVPANCTNDNCLLNNNPLFDSIDVSKRIFDFRLNNNTSPSIDAGVPTAFLKELDNNNRSIPFDIGCYEKQ
jgi:hypothetical protein